MVAARGLPERICFDQLWQVATAVFAGVEFDLPERPEGEIDPGYDELLFDSDRDWTGQLSRYRESKGLPFVQVSDGTDGPDRMKWDEPVPAGPGPERDALVVCLRSEYWTFRQIGDLLSLTESMACKIYKRATRHE